MEHPEGEAIKQHLECPEEGPFEDVDVDDEDYNPSLDLEEDEDETEEIKPEGWLHQYCKHVFCTLC